MIGSPIAGRTRGGARAADRVLRQHPGAAHRPVGRSVLRRDPGAGGADGDRGLRAPGAALREAGGRAGAGAQPGALAALPGDARPPGLRARDPAPGRRPRGAGGDGGRHRQVRPAARPGGKRRATAGELAVRRRPVRQRHGGAHGRGLRAPAGRGGRGSRGAAVHAAGAERGGARAAPRRVERHGRGPGGASAGPRDVRRAGGPHAAGGGRRVRRRASHLRGARPPGQPARAPPGGAGRGGRLGRGPRHGALAGDGGGPARRAQGRRRLGAARSLLPEGAPGLDAGGLRRAGPADAGRRAGRAVQLPPRPPAAGLGGDRPALRLAPGPDSSGGGGGPGQPGLRALHLGLDRTSQGRRGHPRRARRPDAPPAPGARPRRRRRHGGGDHAVVRHRGGRHAAAAHHWRADRAGEPRRSPGRRAAGGADSICLGRLRSHPDAGHAGHLAPVAGRRLGGGPEAAGHQHGRGAAARSRQPAAASCRRAVEPLRPDRVDDLGLGLSGGGRGGADHDRPSGDGHALPHRGPPFRGGAAGRAGRAADRRRRPGARLPGPGGPDGRALRPRSLRHERDRRRAALPRRRPRPLPAGRPGRGARPHRPSSQGARLPHRAGRDRGRAARAPRSARRRGHGPCRAHRPGARGLRRHRRGGGRRGAAWPARLKAAGTPSGLHGAGPLRAAGRDAAPAQRQGRPPRAGGDPPAGHGGQGRAGAAHPGRGEGGRDLARGAADRLRRPRRRLLRAGRPLAARHPGDLAGAQGVRRRAARPQPVRGADARRLGRQGGGGPGRRGPGRGAPGQGAHRGGGRHCPGEPRSDALLRAGAALAARSARAGRIGLQHPAGAAPGGGPRRRGPRSRAARGRPPPRGAADDVRGGGRAAGPGRLGGTPPALRGDRSLAAAGRGARADAGGAAASPGPARRSTCARAR